jgi:hypothetical protein
MITRQMSFLPLGAAIYADVRCGLEYVLFQMRHRRSFFLDSPDSRVQRARGAKPVQRAIENLNSQHANRVVH